MSTNPVLSVHFTSVCLSCDAVNAVVLAVDVDLDMEVDADGEVDHTLYQHASLPLFLYVALDETAE